MSAFSNFIDKSRSLWRNCEHQDGRNFFLACAIFTAGFVLACMSWKLGTSSVFVLLYILLGISGFLISCLSGYKVKREKNAEKLPLLSTSSNFETSAFENRKNPTDENKTGEVEICRNVETKTKDDCGTERPAHCVAVACLKGEDFTSHMLRTEVNENDASPTLVKCADSSFQPRKESEAYATRPSPGGSQSRMSEDQALPWYRSFTRGMTKQSLPNELSDHLHDPFEGNVPSQQSENYSPVLEPSAHESKETQSMSSVQSLEENPTSKDLFPSSENTVSSNTSEMSKFCPFKALKLLLSPEERAAAGLSPIKMKDPLQISHAILDSPEYQKSLPFSEERLSTSTQLSPMTYPYGGILSKVRSNPTLLKSVGISPIYDHHDLANSRILREFKNSKSCTELPSVDVLVLDQIPERDSKSLSFATNFPFSKAECLTKKPCSENSLKQSFVLSDNRSVRSSESKKSSDPNSESPGTRSSTSLSHLSSAKDTSMKSLEQSSDQCVILTVESDNSEGPDSSLVVPASIPKSPSQESSGSIS